MFKREGEWRSRSRIGRLRRCFSLSFFLLHDGIDWETVLGILLASMINGKRSENEEISEN